MKLQNDVQREIVRWVKYCDPVSENLMQHMMQVLAGAVTSPTVRGWIRTLVSQQIIELENWHIIYKKMPQNSLTYYTTDWTCDQITFEVGE